MQNIIEGGGKLNLDPTQGRPPPAGPLQAGAGPSTIGAGVQRAVVDLHGRRGVTQPLPPLCELPPPPYMDEEEEAAQDLTPSLAQQPLTQPMRAHEPHHGSSWVGHTMVGGLHDVAEVLDEAKVPAWPALEAESGPRPPSTSSNEACPPSCVVHDGFHERNAMGLHPMSTHGGPNSHGEGGLPVLVHHGEPRPINLTDPQTAHYHLHQHPPSQVHNGESGMEHHFDGAMVKVHHGELGHVPDTPNELQTYVQPTTHEPPSSTSTGLNRRQHGLVVFHQGGLQLTTEDELQAVSTQNLLTERPLETTTEEGAWAGRTTFRPETDDSGFLWAETTHSQQHEGPLRHANPHHAGSGPFLMEPALHGQRIHGQVAHVRNGRLDLVLHPQATDGTFVHCGPFATVKWATVES